MLFIYIDGIAKDEVRSELNRPPQNHSSWANILTAHTVTCQIALHSTSPARPIELLILFESTSDIHTRMAAESIVSEMVSNGYNAYLVSETEQSDIESTLKCCVDGGLTAVFKTELAITSGSSYNGFYYFVDRMMPSSNPNSWLIPMCDLLTHTSDCYVLFQFVPTMLSDEESAALSTLSGSLDMLCNQGIAGYGGLLLREPSAKEPLAAYSYYATMARQPMFQFSIAVASANGNNEAIAQHIRTMFAPDIGNPPRLETVRVPNASALAEDFGQFPIALQEYLSSNMRNQQIWQFSDSPPYALARLPFLLSVEESSMLMRLPVDDGRIVGFTSSVVPMSNEVISQKHQASSSVLFGERAGRKEPIGCSLKQFTQHALVVGKPGTGKTTFALNLLLQFHDHGIPFLAIEPTKAEYRALIDAIPDLQIYTPGNSMVVPFYINPFLPPKGITTEQYIPSLASAFKAAFSMPSPLDTLFENTIRRCYTAYGWRGYSQASDTNVKPFGLFEFIIEFKRMLSETQYSKEVLGNLQSGGTMRLVNLIEQNPILYDGVSSTPLEELLSKPTVLELNAIENQEQKALLMALLLIQICVYTKHNYLSTGDLKNILLLDEAHVLLDIHSTHNTDDRQGESMTSLTLQNMVAEIRSYGTGVIIADQSPTKVGSGILANTDIKIAFQLVSKGEKKAISDCVNMSPEQENALSNLDKGQAYVFMSGLRTPQVIQTPDIRKQRGIALGVADTLIQGRMQHSEHAFEQALPFSLCRLCKDCEAGCSTRVREDASFDAHRLYASLAPKLTSIDKMIEYTYQLEKLLEPPAGRRQRRCTKIQFFRLSILSKDFQVTQPSQEKWFAEMWKENEK